MAPTVARTPRPFDEVRLDLFEPLVLEIRCGDDRNGTAARGESRPRSPRARAGSAGPGDGLHDAPMAVRRPTVECANLPRVEVERTRPQFRRWRRWWRVDLRVRTRVPERRRRPFPVEGVRERKETAVDHVLVDHDRAPAVTSRRSRAQRGPAAGAERSRSCRAARWVEPRSSGIDSSRVAWVRAGERSGGHASNAALADRHDPSERQPCHAGSVGVHLGDQAALPQGRTRLGPDVT